MGVAERDAKTNSDGLELRMGDNDQGFVRVLLFAALRDQAGWGERRIPVPPADTLTALELWMTLDLGPWSSSWRVAINQVLADPQSPVRAGDELAFLPPFTGG